jgi:hypothetical protein
VAWSTPVIHATGDVVSASDWNVGSNDLSYLYGDTSWTSVSYTNSWVDYGIGFQPVVFRKFGTRVAVRGRMKSGTLSAAAFTLPSGYRPPTTCDFAVASNGAFGLIDVSSAGVVTPIGGSNTYYCLDGVFFDTL